MEKFQLLIIKISINLFIHNLNGLSKYNLGATFVFFDKSFGVELVHVRRWNNDGVLVELDTFVIDGILDKQQEARGRIQRSTHVQTFFADDKVVLIIQGGRRSNCFGHIEFESVLKLVEFAFENVVVVTDVCEVVAHNIHAFWTFSWDRGARAAHVV